ncbi:type II toxin-antitoxin system VapC family toxin [Microbacterium karelineae]|uniref:type II toxin-antitoxin system VapC family toxin n=1 Tax=Microbacterium karelineae TaxID=2654283 RepID=UPI0012EA7139|nr:type II toxin-antitoxin system VapC family toxin [Microbacterium karelineae]
MGEDAVLVDATVALHALGDTQPQRDVCRAFLEGLWAGPGRGYASTEMVQELAFHRLRKTNDRELAVADAQDMSSLFIVLNFDNEVLELSLDLIERTSIRGRDAVHAATALAYGIETIASSDAAFDGIPGLRRIDPLRATAGS